MFGLAVGCRGGKSNTVAVPEIAPRTPLASIIAVGDTLSAAACDTLQLGRMRSGEVIEQNIGVVNLTPQPIVITNTESTCGCTDIDYPTQPLAAGDTARVAIRFDSQGFYGWQFKRIRVYTSADTRPITIYVEAEVE